MLALKKKKIKSLALLHTFHKAISSQIEVGEDRAAPGNLTASLTWSYTLSIYSCQKRILEWTDPWFDQVEDLLCSYLVTAWQEGSLGEVIATTFLFLLHGPSLRTAGIPFKLLIFFFAFFPLSWIYFVSPSLCLILKNNNHTILVQA